MIRWVQSKLEYEQILEGMWLRFVHRETDKECWGYVLRHFGADNIQVSVQQVEDGGFPILRCVRITLPDILSYLPVKQVKVVQLELF